MSLPHPKRLGHFLTALLVLALPALACADDWSRADAAHLLRRAGFGGTPEQVDRLHALGRDAAVGYLVDGKLPDGAKPPFDPVALEDFVPVPREDLFPKPDPKVQERLRQAQMAIREAEQKARRGEPTTAPTQLMKEAEALRRLTQGKALRNAGEELNRLRVWWLGRMIRTDRPAEEKLTLFWHGLFTSGVREVRDPVAMAEQNVLFHQHAMGNYKALTRAVVHDGAMLRYLDNDKNVVGKPNENLARELLELFTMGEGNGYTEQDVKEVARALTGLSPNGGGRPGGAGGRYGDGKVTLRERSHDKGDKTIFGKTGKFGPDDVVELIFERPEPARFLARKLWEFYAYPNPSDADLAPVEAALRASGYELRPALRALFTSPAFYGERAKFALIKSPTELIVSTARLLEASPDQARVASLGQRMREMAQELLQPPNVRGWVGGENWITAATLYVRYNTVTAMVQGAGRGQGDGMRRRPGGAGGGPGGGPSADAMDDADVQLAVAKARAARELADELAAKAEAATGDAQVAARQRADEARAAARKAAMVVRPAVRMAEMAAALAARERRTAKGDPAKPTGRDARRSDASDASVAKLFPKLPADATAAQVVEAAVDRFLQRPLHPEKRQALIDTLADAPLRLGDGQTEQRVRQMIALLLSSPEYQVQ